MKSTLLRLPGRWHVLFASICKLTTELVDMDMLPASASNELHMFGAQDGRTGVKENLLRGNDGSETREGGDAQ